MAQRKKESRPKSKLSSGNVYEDMGYPEPKKAKIKLDLAMRIGEFIKRRKLTQIQAAEVMGIDQPRVSKIVRGLLADFSIEALVYFLVALGCNVEIKLTPSRKTPASIHVARSTQRVVWTS